MSRYSVKDPDEIGRVNEKITYSSFLAIQNSPFVAIQPHGIKPPFYACGHHPRLISLAQAVGSDQPYYKLDAYALLEERLANDHGIDLPIEEIAHYFVSKILTSQKVGPYYLAGGCEGAIIAFEIAQQLVSGGHQIAMLVLWDTPIPKYWSDEAARQLTVRRLRNLFSGGRVEFKRRLGGVINKAKSTFSRANVRSSAQSHVEQVLMKAARNYEAKSYQGHITLFSANESDFECSEPTLGWETLARQGVDVHVLPGNHTTYYQQNFVTFAETLKTCLAKAQTSERFKLNL